jgi:branched-chain amino acid transport system substrate-binding protein
VSGQHRQAVGLPGRVTLPRRRLALKLHFPDDNSSTFEKITMCAFRVWIVVGLCACFMLGGARAQTADCPPQCATGRISLGISAPVSGPAAAFGRQAVKPAEIAIRELNAGGGIMGTPVELAVGDDRCDPGHAATVARQHVEVDKIGVVVGPICPAAAAATTSAYSAAGVIQLLPTVPSSEARRQNTDRMFRTAVSDEQEARALGAYLSREQRGKKISIVYTDAFYRRAIAEMVNASLLDDMKAGVQFEPLTNASGMYDRLVDRLRRNPPDVIYLALDNDMVREFAGRLRKQGVKSLLVGGQRLLSRALVSAAGEAVEGIRVIAPVGPPGNPELRKAVDLLKQADVQPDLVAINTYAAIQLWAEAVRRAGNGNRARVAETLRSGEFQTAVGPIAFDQEGARRDIAFATLTWQGGRWNIDARQ